MTDTQAEIIRILGMDSTTLKSCALIMQDGYGLFLEADKETRMSILGNLLGIGLYADMEQTARECSTENERERQKNLDEINALNETLTDEAALNADISSCKLDVEERKKSAAAAISAADTIKLKLNTKLEAAGRAEKIKSRIASDETKKQDWKKKNSDRLP